MKSCCWGILSFPFVCRDLLSSDHSCVQASNHRHKLSLFSPVFILVSQYGSTTPFSGRESRKIRSLHSRNLPHPGLCIRLSSFEDSKHYFDRPLRDLLHRALGAGYPVEIVDILDCSRGWLGYGGCRYVGLRYQMMSFC